MLGIIIHPEGGNICSAYKIDPQDWISPGLTLAGEISVRPWPVPRLREARLVRCHCNEVGIHPETPEAAQRYIPGSVMRDGQLVLTAGAMEWPQSDGSDEKPMLHEQLRELVVKWRLESAVSRQADELEAVLDG